MIRFVPKEEAVSHQAFDAFTRSAVEGISRRSSLATLGGAGVAALVGGALTAEAKSKNKKVKKLKRRLRKANQKCPQQAEDCRNFIAGAGGNSAQIACCDFLATCNFDPFVPCVNDNAP